jgi:N6-L-threonylcarbamoyladenine synthase
LSNASPTAKMLGLGYPGGPALEAAARTGNPQAFALPRPMLGRPGCDFSFSGLKTAVRQTLDRMDGDALDPKTARDLAASFQQAVADVLADRTRNAIERFQKDFPDGKALVVAGGVAANTVLRDALEATAQQNGLEFVAPPLDLCTDNAAMVAWAGIERLRLGLTDGLDASARPRWPLDETPRESRV